MKFRSTTILVVRKDGKVAMAGGVMDSLPVQNGQVSTCLRVSRGASSSAFFGRMLRAVATSTDSAGTMGLMRISRTSPASAGVSDMTVSFARKA